jgi:hypothetical protein
VRHSQKRQKVAAPDPSVAQLYKQAMQTMWDSINTLTEDGVRLADGFDEQYKVSEMEVTPFLLLGHARSFCYDTQGDPTYDAMITNPMWLTKVNTKIKRNYKTDLAAFRRDMLLVFDNAMLYNQDGSFYFINAQKMKDHFNEIWSKQMQELGLDEQGVAAPTPPPAAAPKKLTLKLGKAGGGANTPSGKRSSTPVPRRGAVSSLAKRKKAIESSEDEEEASDEDMSDDDSDD